MNALPSHSAMGGDEQSSRLGRLIGEVGPRGRAWSVGNLGGGGVAGVSIGTRTRVEVRGSETKQQKKKKKKAIISVLAG